MTLKNNKWLSIFIIALIYILATACGIVVYHYLPFVFWLNLLIADVVSTIVVFIFSVILKNASVYDPYWSVQPIVILVLFALYTPMNWQRVLPLIAVCLWGIRLTANWAYTFHGMGHQDWRYTMLKEQTGKFYPIINFVGIHLVPTLVVYACVLPAVFTFVYDTPFTAWSVVFFAVSVFAFTMQGIADVQMQSFRNSKTGGFIRKGLWKYSRHPNYLGEILMWWGIALAFVCSYPSMWYLILGAVLNTILFFSVSLPMAEKRQSKKQGFAEYKKATRLLLPIKK